MKSAAEKKIFFAQHREFIKFEELQRTSVERIMYAKVYK